MNRKERTVSKSHHAAGVPTPANDNKESVKRWLERTMREAPADPPLLDWGGGDRHLTIPGLGKFFSLKEMIDFSRSRTRAAPTVIPIWWGRL